jgi:hypothetical protein
VHWHTLRDPVSAQDLTNRVTVADG